jgi:hypothetical protein
MHRSATQKTVALSSCKAELNAAVLFAQNMMYQRNTLESIRLRVELSMILEMDNKEAVDLVNSFSVGGHTQHINIKQSFLQELRLIGGPVQDFPPLVFFPGGNHFLQSLSKSKQK